MPSPTVASSVTGHPPGYSEYTTPSQPSLVYSALPRITPHLVQANNSYIYVTDFGNYTFPASLPYIMKFTDRYGNTSVSFSAFWINSTKALIPLNPYVTFADDWYFRMQVDVYYLFTKVGTLYEEWQFGGRVSPEPKISIQFNRTAAWTYGDFNIFWVVAGLSFAKYRGSNTVQNITNGTLVSWANTTQVEMGPTQDPMAWRSYVVVDWGDEGIANVKYGRFSLFASSLTVVRVDFTTNKSTVDPYLIGAGTATSFAYTHQRKIYAAQGLLWVFYGSSSGIVYSTSTDGMTWSSPTLVSTTSIYGHSFALWYDKTYNKFEYAMCDQGSYYQPLYYRRGTPYSNGTIIWDSAEQMVLSGIQYITEFTIATDTNGYPYIAYRRTDNETMQVIKSANNNGVWSTASGWPQSITTGTRGGLILPLTNGKMGLAISVGNEAFTTWNGTTWSSLVYGSSANYDDLSGVSIGDKLYVAVGSVSGAMLNIYDSVANMVSQVGVWSWSGNIAPYIGMTSDHSQLIIYQTYGGVTVYKNYFIVNGTLSGNNTVSDTNSYQTEWSGALYESSTNIMLFVGSMSSGYNLYADPLSVVPLPTLSNFTASSSVVSPDTYFTFNVTASSVPATQVYNVTVALAPNVYDTNQVVLKWDNATNAFSVLYDPNGYATLDVTGSSKTVIDANTFVLTWRLKISSTFPGGYVQCPISNTTIQGVNTKASYGATNVFYLSSPSATWGGTATAVVGTILYGGDQNGQNFTTPIYNATLNPWLKALWVNNINVYNWTDVTGYARAIALENLAIWNDTGSGGPLIIFYPSAIWLYNITQFPDTKLPAGFSQVNVSTNAALIYPSSWGTLSASNIDPYTGAFLNSPTSIVNHFRVVGTPAMRWARGYTVNLIPFNRMLTANNDQKAYAFGWNIDTWDSVGADLGASVTAPAYLAYPFNGTKALGVTSLSSYHDGTQGGTGAAINPIEVGGFLSSVASGNLEWDQYLTAGEARYPVTRITSIFGTNCSKVAVSEGGQAVYRSSNAQLFVFNWGLFLDSTASPNGIGYLYGWMNATNTYSVYNSGNQASGSSVKVYYNLASTISSWQMQVVEYNLANTNYTVTGQYAYFDWLAGSKDNAGVEGYIYSFNTSGTVANGLIGGARLWASDNFGYSTAYTGSTLGFTTGKGGIMLPVYYDTNSFTPGMQIWYAGSFAIPNAAGQIRDNSTFRPIAISGAPTYGFEPVSDGYHPYISGGYFLYDGVSNVYLLASTPSSADLPPVFGVGGGSPTTVTAASVTITTSPVMSFSLIVDGVTYSAPQTFSWNPGTQHTIGVISPIGDYVWQSWSDGGAQTHTITVTGSTTITAYYTSAPPSGPPYQPPPPPPPPPPPAPGTNSTTTIPPGGSGSGTIVITPPGPGYQITDVQVDPSFPWVSFNGTLPMWITDNATLSFWATPPPSLAGLYKVPVTITMQDPSGATMTQKATLGFEITPEATGSYAQWFLWGLLLLLLLVLMDSFRAKKK